MELFQQKIESDTVFNVVLLFGQDRYVVDKLIEILIIAWRYAEVIYELGKLDQPHRLVDILRGVVRTKFDLFKALFIFTFQPRKKSKHFMDLLPEG